MLMLVIGSVKQKQTLFQKASHHFKVAAICDCFGAPLVVMALQLV